MKVHEKKHSCDPRSQTPSAPCVNIKKKPSKYGDCFYQYDTKNPLIEDACGI